MGRSYRLLCSCGYRLAVTATQAGSHQTCPKCGAKVEVPTMRQLRLLPAAEVGEDRPAKERRWGVGQGMAFVTGLLLVVVSLIALSLLAAKRSTLQTKPPSVSQIHGSIDPDTISPSQLWNGWVDLFRSERLEGRETPYFLQQRHQYRVLTGWIVVAAGTAVVGLLVAAGAALAGRIGGKSPRP